MAEFLTDEVLQIAAKSKGKISGLTLKNLCNEGQNFVGILKEITFTISEKDSNNESHHNVILKYPNKQGCFYSVMQNLRGFEKETKTYSDFIPSIEEWQLKTFGTIKYEVPLPKCLYNDNDKNLFIMENLVIQGFETLPSLIKGINYDQSKSVIEELAVFHALGYAYIRSFKNKDVFFEKFPYLRGTTREEFNQIVNVVDSQEQTLGMFHAFFSVLEAKYPDELETCEKIHASLKSIRSLESIYDFYAVHKEYNVVCHGDLWGNNILFKTNESGILRTKFVDLQGIKYCNPAADLIHFFWVSSSEDVLSKHMEELISFYYSTFERIVQDFNYDVSFTLTDLRENVRTMHLAGFTRYIMQAMASFGKGNNVVDASSEGLDSFYKQLNDLMKIADDNMLQHCRFRMKFADSLDIFN